MIIHHGEDESLSVRNQVFQRSDRLVRKMSVTRISQLMSRRVRRDVQGLWEGALLSKQWLNHQTCFSLPARCWSDSSASLYVYLSVWSPWGESMSYPCTVHYGCCDNDSLRSGDVDEAGWSGGRSSYTVSPCQPANHGTPPPHCWSHDFTHPVSLRTVYANKGWGCWLRRPASPDRSPGWGVGCGSSSSWSPLESSTMSWARLYWPLPRPAFVGRPGGCCYQFWSIHEPRTRDRFMY